MLDSVVGGGDGRMFAGERTQGSGDWSGLLAEVIGYFGRTKNLGLARFALLAAMNLDGLSGLADGVVLYNQLLSHYWEDVYPRIEGGNFEERLESISHIDDPFVASSLGNIVVAKGKRSGSYTLDQALSSMNRGEPSPSLIEGSVNETISADPEFYDKLAAQCQEVRQQLGFIRDILQKHVGSPSVSFSKVEGRLSQLEAFLTHSAVAPAGSAPTEERADSDAPIASAKAQPGEIRNRTDVVRAIDQIIRFYRKTEPTSPVPHLLHRAKRVVSMDFMEIVEEFRLNGSPAIGEVFGALDENASSN